MNLDKIPFETALSYNNRHLFVESNTHVFAPTGKQYSTLVGVECRELLNTHLDCDELIFGARISLNVLIVLKVGI